MIELMDQSYDFENESVTKKVTPATTERNSQSKAKARQLVKKGSETVIQNIP